MTEHASTPECVNVQVHLNKLEHSEKVLYFSPTLFPST